MAKGVTGTVTSKDGRPLAGVTVALKGTSVGTRTDEKGAYSLTIPDTIPTPVLVFSYVGYLKKEEPVNNRSAVNVVLQEDVKSLEQLVVVGYGTQKKVNLTGAVGTASGERLENRSIANVGEGLQGVVPNLNVTVRNGDPAASPGFNVRGFTSINGGGPLILVDGVPMDINRINPADIKSVSVLKDASAAAVYGARAAYGVILVETKSGQRGKVHISLNTQWSLAKPIFKADVISDPYQFVSIENVASMRTNGVPAYDSNMVAGTKAWSEHPETAPEWGVVNGVLRFYGYNNYQNKLLTDFAPTNQHDLSISGGSENADYYVSAGYLTKDGYLRYNNTNFKRYNILMKGDFKVNKWLQLNEKVVFNSQNNNQPHFYNWDVNINSLARVSPIQPIQFPDLPQYLEPGDHDKYAQYIGMYFGGTNFYPYLLDGGRTTFANNDTWLTTGATITPLKGLTIKSDFSYEIFNRNYQDVASKIDIVDADLTNPTPVSHGFSDPDWIENQNQYNRYYVFNVYGEYAFDFLADHHVTATIGFNQEWGQNKYVVARAYSLISPSVTDIHATTGDQQTNGSSSEVALRGAFYRLKYNYQDRYLLEADGRYDGTSRFPEKDRFGFFPSFSAGWRISNEHFMEGTRRWLDNLKIRASYGSLGNQLLTDNNNNPLYYPYIPTLGSGTAPYIMSGDSRIPYVSAPGLVSPSLTWETVVSKNIGLDFTLLQQRLDVSLDAYTRDTKDMLMRKEYPDILGADAPQTNAADLRTKGWEASLTWHDKIKSDFSYDITLSLSDWTSEITRYENPSGNIDDYYVGKKIGAIWGYKTVGIFQSQEDVDKAVDQSKIGANWQPGDIQYADLNGDGEISPGSRTLDDHGDLTVIGNNTPRYQFGLNINLNYKNWRLTTFFQGVGKRKIWPQAGNWTWFFPFNSGYLEKWAVTDTWSEDNRDAYFYAPYYAYNDKKNVQTQSRFLQNAAYMRLKNITLSYELPRQLINKIGLEQVEVYFTGMNLWEFSRIRRPLDPESIPEVTAETNGAIEYPMQRIYTLGARISL
ncbi:TonB-dependent receptor [Compostibacter hankyongensis]|uniref:TonB-dependent receptor n=2 Tax=Compostibacter hankyongensis TaxID=1007089 RepID=A0ABP8FNP4_9BACT